MKKITMFSILFLILFVTSIQIHFSLANDYQSPKVIKTPQKLSDGILYTDTSVYSTLTPPNVSNGLKDPIWNALGFQQLNFTNSSGYVLPVNISVVHDSNYFYIAYQYHDATPFNSSNQTRIDQIQLILDINESASWNQVGGDVFDVLYGTFLNGTLNPYVSDHFENNTGFYPDVGNGGQSNTLGFGSYNFTSHTYFYELAQPMTGNDTSHDINLHVGDSILYLASVWVDGNTFSSPIGNFNIRQHTFDWPPNITVLTLHNNDTITSFPFNLNYSINTTASWIGLLIPDLDVANETIPNDHYLTFNFIINGPHTLILYANDTFGVMGKSAEIHFFVNVTVPLTTSSGTTSSSSVTTTSLISSSESLSQPSSKSSVPDFTVFLASISLVLFATLRRKKNSL